MTAINWDAKPEPWRTIGKEWCEHLFTLANGGEPRPPAVRIRPDGTWDGVHFRERLAYHRLTRPEAARRLGVHVDTISKWCAGHPPTEGRRVAIAAMFEQARLES